MYSLLRRIENQNHLRVVCQLSLFPIYNLLISVTTQDATIELSLQVNTHNNYMIFFYNNACLFLYFHLLIGILNCNLMGILGISFVNNESTYLTMRLEAILWICNLIYYVDVRQIFRIKINQFIQNLECSNTAFFLITNLFLLRNFEQLHVLLYAMNFVFVFIPK